MALQRYPLVARAEVFRRRDLVHLETRMQDGPSYLVGVVSLLSREPQLIPFGGAEMAALVAAYIPGV